MVLGHVKYWQLLECKKRCGRASYDIEINHIEINMVADSLLLSFYDVEQHLVVRKVV